MTAVFVAIRWLSLTYQDLDESVNHFLISFSKKIINEPIAINAIIKKKEREKMLKPFKNKQKEVHFS